MEKAFKKLKKLARKQWVTLFTGEFMIHKGGFLPQFYDARLDKFIVL